MIILLMGLLGVDDSEAHDTALAPDTKSSG
jgi:hypothetical protein